MYVQNALRVCIQNVSVCTGTTPACVSTCGRGAGTQGDVFNVHGFFSVSDHTPRPHHTNVAVEEDTEEMKRWRNLNQREWRRKSWTSIKSKRVREEA